MSGLRRGEVFGDFRRSVYTGRMRNTGSLLTLVVCCSTLAAGCGKPASESSSNVTVGKQFSIDPFKKRSTTLAERAREGEETGDRFGGISSSDSPYTLPNSDGSTTGGTIAQRGTFAFGSGGVDDLQVATNDRDPKLDLNSLEAETVDSNYKRLFDRGEDYLKQGKVDLALIAFDEAKSLDPNKYSAYVGEAFAYFRKGDFGRALAAIDFAIRTSPGQIVLYNHRAHIRSQMGDYTAAIDDISRVLKADPNDMSALVTRAQLYGQINNHAGAVADFNAALKSNPDDLALRLYRGISYFKMGRLAESIADATAVIGKRRDQIDPFFLRAVAKWQSNDLAGGRSDFDEAVKLGLSPNIAESWRPRFYPPTPGAPVPVPAASGSAKASGS